MQKRDTLYRPCFEKHRAFDCKQTPTLGCCTADRFKQHPRISLGAKSSSRQRFHYAITSPGGDGNEQFVVDPVAASFPTIPFLSINQTISITYEIGAAINRLVRLYVYMYVASWCLNVLLYPSRRLKSKYVEYFRACKEQWSGMRLRSVRQSARRSLLTVGPMIHS